MTRMSSKAAYQGAIDLIEAQLQALPAALAVLVASAPPTIPRDRCDDLLQSRRHHLRDTGSVGNIVASASQEPPEVHVCMAMQPALHGRQRESYLITIIGNALLAVGMYLKEHDMAAMRTPEIQFLDHACIAILNGNRFHLEAGYMPIASFDGLVIDSKLDGMPLFDQQGQQGLMGWGDAIALLQWLLRYLDGTRHFVSGGDAG